MVKHMDLNLTATKQVDKLRAIENEVSRIHLHYYLLLWWRILDRLSLGPNGRQLTEMEIFILQNHFKEHFTRPGKRWNPMRESDL